MTQTQIFRGRQLVHFRRWSRKSYAIFNSLGKIIKISPLKVSFSILTLTVCTLQAQNKMSQEAEKEVKLDELEVTAQANPLVFTPHGRIITTLTQKEIQAAPVSDLAGLLNFVQSVDIRQRGPNDIQSDLSIRGGSFDQTLVLLNGIPISDPQTGHFNLNIPIDLHDIQRIEVLKGPAARIYGPGAYSGAVNIITRIDEENSVAARLSAGQNDFYHWGTSLQLNKNFMKSKWSYFGKKSSGYMKNTDFVSHNGFWQSQLQGSGFLVESQLAVQHKDFGANSFYSPKYELQYELNRNLTASLGVHFGKKLRVSVVPWYRQHRDNWQLNRENPTLYQNFHQTAVWGVQSKAITRTQLGKTSIGLQWSSEQLQSSSMGEKLEEPREISWAKGQFFKYSYERNHLSLYLEQSKNISSKIHVSVGALVHYLSSNESWNVYPGIELSYALSDSSALFASANQAMRLPTFTDLFYSGPANMGNSQLKPERATSYELGFRTKSEAFSWESNVFLKKGTDIIDWIWYDTIWKTENMTRLTTFGFEANASVNPQIIWETKWFKQLNVNYTYLNIDKAGSDYQSKYALNNIRHQVNVSALFQPLKHWYLSINGSYKDRLGTYQIYNFTTKEYENRPNTDYFTWNARVVYKPPFAEFFVELHNISDSKVVEFGVPQPGFQALAGVNRKLQLKPSRNNN